MLTGIAAGLVLGVLVGVLQACRPLRKVDARRRFLISSTIVIVGALLVAALELGSRGSAYAQNSSTGQWSTLQTWPYLPVHAQMLPTGKVMFWDKYENADNPQLWDPTTASISAAAQA